MRFWTELTHRLRHACRRSAAAALLGLLATWAGAAEDNFLEPEKAFRFSARVLDERAVEVRFDITPGYYMYREQLKFAAAPATLGAPEVPPGKVKFDETFQKNVETYRGALAIRIPVAQAAGAFRLDVVSQGCADAGLCYPPMTSSAQVSLKGFGGDGSVRLAAANADAGTPAQASAAVAPPATAPAQAAAAAATSRAALPGAASWASDSSMVDRVLHSGHFWWIVGSFFVMGLLLAFTPCVLPMLPILSSIIAGSDDNATRSHGLAMAVSYSLGMALVYSGLGIAAGLAGEGLAAYLQNPWVLVAFALALAAFALSMFDVYELKLPVAFTERMTAHSQRLPAGRAAGVFAMGALSAVIVSPCVSAPLAGALVFIGQTRDVALGGSALFSLSAGMSVPLLLVGASAGAWLPKSGPWMMSVKRFFGVLLFGVAIWVVQPVLPHALALGAWGLLLLVAGFMLRPFDEHTHAHATAPRTWLKRAVGVASLTLGVMQIVGAASGGTDPLQPLGHFGRAVAATVERGARFEPVRSVAELDARLKAAGRPVMLDFYADWCVSCKEMERYTFSDPEIAARMSRALLLKADVTANNADDRELLKRFRLFGPPGTIFFDPQGRELDGVRVIGFQNAQRFGESLKSAGL
ncbi:MAG: protein-disulfide reductase DsbD [Burkholderiaceae bacterium]